MSVEQVEQVERDVRELVRRRGLDPTVDPAVIRAVVDEVVSEHEERAARGTLTSLADPDAVAKHVHDAVAGLGPLQRYLDDPSIEEIWINEPGRVFVARAGLSELTPTVLDELQVRELVERMLRSTNRRVDTSSPFVDAGLPDGSRLHVTIPDITRRHWAVKTANQ